jgi:LacI family transcriptional regulator
MTRQHGVTITQVAITAGVSRSTASRVFTRPALFRPETVQRVLDAARELGYTGSRGAAPLPKPTSPALGLVIPDITNPYFPPLIRAAQLRALADDAQILIADSMHTRQHEAAAVAHLAARTDAVIVASSRQSRSAILAIVDRARLVLINRDIPSVPRVLVSTGDAVRQGVLHLAELGHRQVAYLAGPQRSWSNLERLTAARAACDQANLRFLPLHGYGPTFEEGQRAVNDVVRCGATALIAYNDMMAHGLIAGLAEIGRQVPTDLSVVGCDGAVGVGGGPTLTSVEARAAQAGAAAVDLALAGASGDERVVLSCDWRLGDTTAAPPADS